MVNSPPEARPTSVLAISLPWEFSVMAMVIVSPTLVARVSANSPWVSRPSHREPAWGGGAGGRGGAAMGSRVRGSLDDLLLDEAQPANNRAITKKSQHFCCRE